MIEKFSISVDDDQVMDLHRRLSDTRWINTIDNVGWGDGTPTAELREIVDYWKSHYNWREQESKLNSWPQYKYVFEDGQYIHFIWKKGTGSSSRPLLLSHGWPGSIVEFLGILPLLTDPEKHGGSAEDSFDVVVPSLPGYAFSSQPREPGTNPFTIAKLFADLMGELGYSKFFAQGGDWGGFVVSALALQFPERVQAIHLNYVPATYLPHAENTTNSSEEASFKNLKDDWLNREGGYSHIQGTKPSTLAIGLNDSPAGLAAWIYEKFHTWSDRNSTSTSMNLDDILTNISIYWFTGTIYSSIRLYWEARAVFARPESFKFITTPTGVSVFPGEIPLPRRSWIGKGYNLVYWNELPEGGHFAAMEQPVLLARELWSFFASQF